MNFIILPNQLFDKKYLPDKSYTYILWGILNILQNTNIIKRES